MHSTTIADYIKICLALPAFLFFGPPGFFITFITIGILHNKLGFFPAMDNAHFSTWEWLVAIAVNLALGCYSLFVSQKRATLEAALLKRLGWFQIAYFLLAYLMFVDESQNGTQSLNISLYIFAIIVFGLIYEVRLHIKALAPAHKDPN